MQDHVIPVAKTSKTRRTLFLGIVYLGLLGAATLREYSVIVRPSLTGSRSGQSTPFIFREYEVIVALLATVFSVVLLTLPIASQRLREMWNRWRPAYTVGLLLLFTGILCALIIRFSDLQFNAFDEAVVVDTMWRQAIGQIAYRDFITTNPPLFVLGLKLAATLFGASWNAQAYLLSVFSAITFLWTYWLLRRLDLAVPLAMLLAVSAQMSGVALLSFWWVNSLTAVAAGIFVLSCLHLLRRPRLVASNVSWVLALALLLLLKPNTTGLLGLPALLTLLVVMRARLRLLLLTFVAVGLCVELLLANHISPANVLSSYAGAAKSRAFQFRAFHIHGFFTAEIVFQLACFCVTLLPTFRVLRNAVNAPELEQLACLLLLLLGSIVGVFALASNGDIADVALAPVLVCTGVLVAHRRREDEALYTFYIALVCALLCTQFYKGETRLRNELASGFYYASPAAIVPVHNRFFEGVRTGPVMNEVLAETGDALARNPGPVFFAPRLEWAYAAFQLPSPKDLPVFWEAGTSFDPADMQLLLERWDSDRFPTVVSSRVTPFGEDDWVYFPSIFQARLTREYVPDRSTYSSLIVWRRRPGL